MVLYNVACIYSLSAAAAAQDKSLEQTKRSKLADEYALYAIDLLKRAQATGFFKDSKNVELLRTDNDLDPLRKQEEFKKLLAEIDSAAKAKLQKQKKKQKKQSGIKKKNDGNRDRPLMAPRPKLDAPKPRG